MGDLDSTAGTSTGVPVIEIFGHSTGSNAGATGLASLILMVGLGASSTLTATGGRSIYAFARDRGLPFSNWLSRVNAGNATPVNGLCAAVAVQFVLLAIYFGAVQGFVTVISIATEGFCMSFPPSPISPPPILLFPPPLLLAHQLIQTTTDVSYALPLLARLLSLLTATPHTRIASHYSLGRYSIPLNAIGLAFLAFTCVTFNFPSVAPVDEQNMNYTSAAVGVVMFIALVTWVTTGRRQFTGSKSGGVVVEMGGDVEVAGDLAAGGDGGDGVGKEGGVGGPGSWTGVSGEVGGLNGQERAEVGNEAKGEKGDF